MASGFYDPVIARWTAIDPLSEKSRRYSPYVYVEDNSIRNIDVDGMFSTHVDEYGNVLKMMMIKEFMNMRVQKKPMLTK